MQQNSSSIMQQSDSILSADNLNRNFGVPLDKCESSSTSPYVPVVVEICTRLIELHIIDEGIYRKVGQKQVVTSLRAQLNHGILNIDISDFNWDNPHAVVSLLKCFLNELPDSLTTSHMYGDFIQVCRIDHHHIRLIAVKKLLRKLPIYNYETLKYITAHLRRVAAAYQHNKMTVKNLCIAFSQSIVRHNDANCETIKTDHVLQSLLIELILVYHDWLFDSTQMDNVPNEIKDIVESNLFQQFYSYIEPICYTDLLLNIMKSIRARWNSTNSSMNSNNSRQIMNQNNYNSSSGNELEYPLSGSMNSNNNNNNGPRQPINIQFRSDNKHLRNAKSVSVLNRSRNNETAENIMTKSVEVTNKSNKPKQSLSSKKSFSQSKHRSRSVEVRFKSIGAFLNTNQQPKSKTNSDSNSKALKKNSIANEENNNQFNNKYESEKASRIKNNSTALYSKVQKSTPLSRKTYNDIKPTSYDCASANIDISTSSASISTNTAANTINFKVLEKKNELEREKLNQIMKKLEIDLMNAKIDLMDGEDYLRSTPINVMYPTLCVSSPLVNDDIKTSKLTPSIFSNDKKNSSNINNSNNKSLFSSVSSTSSGVVATTGPSSSSASSVSTSPPLHNQHGLIRKNKTQTAYSGSDAIQLNSLSSISSNSDISSIEKDKAVTSSKPINEISLINIAENETKTNKNAKNYFKPARRHTIALSTVELSTLNKYNNNDSDYNENSSDYRGLSNILSQIEQSQKFSQQMYDHPYNEFNFLTNQELRQQLLDKNKTSNQMNYVKAENSIEYIDKNQTKLFRHPINHKLENSSLDLALDKSMSNDLIRLVSNNRRHTIQHIKQSSKSIANLPSLTNKFDNLKPAFHNNLAHINKKHEHAEHHVKATILNLSPLSISASSVTTGGLNSVANSSSSTPSSNSSSINSLINNSNKNKLKLDQVATNLANEVGSITSTAVNTIQTDAKNSETNETKNEAENVSNVQNSSNSKYHNNFTVKPQQNIQFNCTFESLI